MSIGLSVAAGTWFPIISETSPLIISGVICTEKYLFTLYKNDCIDHSSHQNIKWSHSIPFPDSPNNKYGGFVGDRVSPFQTGKINVYSHSKESNKIYLCSDF